MMRLSALLPTVFLFASCQVPPKSALLPARILAGDEASLTALKAALASELGRARITFGAGDPAVDGRFSVLPPPSGPLEMNNPALPETFTLLSDGKTCSARREATGEVLPLKAVKCEPLTDQ